VGDNSREDRSLSRLGWITGCLQHQLGASMALEMIAFGQMRAVDEALELSSALSSQNTSRMYGSDRCETGRRSALGNPGNQKDDLRELLQEL